MRSRESHQVLFESRLQAGRDDCDRYLDVDGGSVSVSSDESVRHGRGDDDQSGRGGDRDGAHARNLFSQYHPTKTLVRCIQQHLE